MTALPLQAVPDTQELELRAGAWPDRARALVVADDSAFVAASETLNEIKSLRKEIDATFDPIIKKAHEAHAEAIAQKRRHETPLAEAEQIIKRTLTVYRSEQERKAAEERRRLEDEARKREEERLLSEALDAEAAGEDEAAMQIIAEPIAPPPVRVAPPTPKVAGVQFRETWTFTCDSLLEVVKHVAAHPEDLNLLQLNTVAVRQMVNARKSLMKVPGIRVYSEKTVAAGGRR
jgi:hypothetical protein